MSCCEEQRGRRSSSVLLQPATRPYRRPAVSAWEIGLRLRGARYERSCTEHQRRFSIPSSIPVSVSSDTPFEKGASRCSPGTSQRARGNIASDRCFCNYKMSAHSATYATNELSGYRG